jgi:hypothetical protein
VEDEVKEVDDWEFGDIERVVGEDGDVDDVCAEVVDVVDRIQLDWKKEDFSVKTMYENTTQAGDYFSGERTVVVSA